MAKTELPEKHAIAGRSGVLPRTGYARWWLEKTSADPATVARLRPRPLVSILMPVYNASPVVLFKALQSVRQQSYPNWELCIADDCSTRTSTRLFLKGLKAKRYKVRYLDANLNISGASNQAAGLARGEYLALLDNDDELHPDALYHSIRTINQTGADLVYSDEDFIDLDGEYESPHFKPDFSPDLLLSHNYITHLSVFKKSLFDRVGGFRSEFDGAQDYDLFLRMTEQANRIEHVPEILYHWRKSLSSTSMSVGAKPYTHERGKAAVKAALNRRGVGAEVEDANLPNYYRVRYRISGMPLVSIVIPFKDKSHLLSGCLDSVLQKTAYKQFEIIGVSNNSQQAATFETMQRYQQRDSRIRFIEHNRPFNFSALVNHGVDQAQGDHVVLMNNDIDVINKGWLEAMLEHSQRPEIAVVGAKLYFGNDTIQHAGVGIGLGGAAGHLHLKFPRYAHGYFNRLNVVQNISALTGALMMVEARIYRELGGFDEKSFRIAYNDVDFCLRAVRSGYLNIFTPYAQAFHYESISRGYDHSGGKLERLNHEKGNLWAAHGELLEKGDPYYNPNLDPGRDDFQLPHEQIR